MDVEEIIPIVDTEEEKNIIQGYLDEDNHNNKISIIHGDEMLKSDIDYIQSNNESFNRLLEIYVNNTSKNLLSKLWFKIIFFVACVLILVAIATVMIWVTIYCLKNPVDKENLIITMINSIVSFAASFIILPHTIASYLFNTDEEKDMTEVVKSLQEHDTKIRERI